MSVHKRKIDEIKLSRELRAEEEANKEAAVQSLFAGFTSRGKEVTAKNILVETPDLENYNRYSAIIRDYFFSIEKNHKSFALLLGKLLSDKRTENIGEFINKLETKNLTPEQVSTEFQNAILGTQDSETRMLLSGLSKLYAKNNAVFEEFKKRARKQNPIYDFIEENKANETILQSKFEEFAKKFDLGEKPTYKDFIRLEEELQQLASGEITSKGRKKIASFQNYMYSKMGTNISEEIALSEMASEYKELKKINSLKRLREIHEKSALSARVFIIKAFQSGKNPKMLGSLFYQSGMTADEVTRNKSELEDYIHSSILSLKSSNPSIAYNFSPEVIKEITKEISQKYVEALSKEDKVLLDNIDDQANQISSDSKITPDIRMEEEFMKITEDTVYNVMMKHNSFASNVSGLDTYNELVREYNLETQERNINRKVFEERNEAIDITQNSINGFYAHPAKGGDAYKLGLDALSLWNLRTIAKSIGDGTITKEEAKKGILSSIPRQDLSDAEKSVFTNELMKKFDNQELLKAIDVERDIYKRTGDIIMNYNAKRLYSKIYTHNIGKFATNKRILSKMSLELQSCLESASSPKISSHSGSSEVSQCFETFKKNSKESAKELQQMAGQPAAALAGISFLAIITTAYKEGIIHATTRELYDMERERISAIDFIKMAETEKDKHFRSLMIKNNKFYMSEEIIEKKDLDEWVFRTVVAKHDFEMHDNIRLSNAVRNIRSSLNQDLSVQALREEFKNILQDSETREEFNAFLRKQQIELRKEFLAKKDKFAQEAKETEEILSSFANDNSRSKNTDKYTKLIDGSAKAYENYLNDLTKAYQLGHISLKEAEKEFIDYKSRTNIALKFFVESEKSIRSEILKTKDEIEKLEKAENSALNLQALQNAKEKLEHTQDELVFVKESAKELQKIIEKSEEFTVGFSYQKELKENQDVFSQLIAFGDDKEASHKALKERYSNLKIIDNSVAQDLILLEQFQKSLKENGASQQKLKSISSLKVLIREYYISQKTQQTNNKKTANEILRDLYNAKKDVFTNTADLDFTLVEQADPTKTQVIIKEKANKFAPKRQIADKIDEALDAIKQFHSSEIFVDGADKTKLSKINPKDLSEKVQEAYKIMESTVGLEISPSSSKTPNSGDKKLSQRTQISINNDDTSNNYVQHMAAGGGLS